MNFKALAILFAVTASIFQTSMGVAAIVTFEGSIAKVVPEKREIYVLADGKKHELYFNEKTRLEKAGQPVSFDQLKPNGKVKVTADKIGKRLDPVTVELVD
jgi:cold shock protein